MVGKYRLAVIGTGIVANFLSSFMCMEEDFDLVWVASQHLDHAVQFAKTYYFKYATDDYTKIPPKDVDFVYVATWQDKHAVISNYFLSQGIPVLCEKPYVLDSWECQKTIEIAQKQGVCFMVNVVSAYVPGLSVLSSLLKQYGPVTDIRISMGKKHTPDNTKLFTDFEYGGVYIDLSSYVFCFLRKLFHQKPVFVKVDFEPSGTDVDMCTLLRMSYEGGPQVDCKLSMLEDLKTAAYFQLNQGILYVEEFARVGKIWLYRGSEKELLYDANHHFMGFEYVFNAIRKVIDERLKETEQLPYALISAITEDIQHGLQHVRKAKW